MQLQGFPIDSHTFVLVRRMIILGYELQKEIECGTNEYKKLLVCAKG